MQGTAFVVVEVGSRERALNPADLQTITNIADSKVRKSSHVNNKLLYILSTIC